eukprot:m.234987 g.234987  ORF g.234987 m.234987 type:complete len:205 (+) comp15258_c3_seq6:305-919(+)
MSRAKNFEKAYHAALSKLKQKAEWGRFAKQYPELVPQGSSDYFQQLHSQYLNNVEKTAQAEFKMIMEQNQLEPALDRLDSLEADAKSKAATETEVPVCVRMQPQAVDTAVLAASLDAVKERKQALQEQLEQIRVRNSALEAEVTQLRQEAKQRTDASADIDFMTKAVNTLSKELNPKKLQQLEKLSARFATGPTQLTLTVESST